MDRGIWQATVHRVAETDNLYPQSLCIAWGPQLAHFGILTYSTLRL